MAPTMPFKRREFSWDPKEKLSSSPHRSKSREQGKDPKHPSEKDGSKHRAKRKKRGVAEELEDDDHSEIRVGSDDDDDSDLDLDRDLYAIGDYLDNKTELIDSMFHALRGNTLSRMIPPVLRDMKHDELKEKCLYELQGLSRKRVRAILSAKEVYSSSGTDDSSSEEEPEAKESNIKAEIDDWEPPEQIRQKNISRPKSPEDSVPESDESHNSDGEISIDLAPVDFGILHKPDAESGSEGEIDPREDSSRSVSPVIATQQPKDLEMIELELRRTALQSMMKQLDTKAEDGEIGDSDEKSMKESRRSKTRSAGNSQRASVSSQRSASQDTSKRSISQEMKPSGEKVSFSLRKPVEAPKTTQQPTNPIRKTSGAVSGVSKASEYFEIHVGDDELAELS